MSKFWQETVRASILAKNRKTITIPAFAVRSGETRGGWKFDPTFTSGHAVIGPYTGETGKFRTAVTLEGWAKTTSSHFGNAGYLLTISSNSVTLDKLSVWCLDQTVHVSVGIAGPTQVDYDTGVRYPQGEWFHFAVTYDQTNLKLYINGKLSWTQAYSTALLNENNHVISIGSQYTTVDTQFIGHIAECRVWEIVLTKEQIAENMFYQRGKNSGLSKYYRASSSSQIVDLLDNTKTYTITGDFVTFLEDEAPPLVYGSSFITAKFAVAASHAFALNYPTEVPADANFMLCVSYTSDDDETVRYRLWDMDGVNFEPFPARYRGQTLPANCTFEVWNIDGEDDCTLEDDLVIPVSKVNVPSSMTDASRQDFVTDPTIDYSIFQTLPLSFPLTFETSGWGTVASPVTQPVGTYSTNLSNYGAIQ